MRSRVSVLVLALVLAGCAPMPGAASGPDEFGTVTSTKVLVGKREPDTLVARDGSLCRVSPDRFEDAEVGQTLRCRWKKG